MEKVVRKFSSFAEADAADDEYYRQLSPAERLRILLALRAQTYPEASETVWRDFLELLRANGVAFLVVGAVAVAWHGHPHLTHDIDIFIGPSAANVTSALAALRQFGVAQPLRPDQVVRIGESPNSIDLVTSLSGVSFDEAWDGRVAGYVGETPVEFIGFRELIRNKDSTGRPSDFGDAGVLRQRNPR